MFVKMIITEFGFFKPATSADECTMRSFGVYDDEPINQLFTRDELKAIESRTGLCFVRPI